jgi:predicted RNA-binding protein Jag
MQFLRLSDDNLLNYKVLEEGKKKFWIFGPKLTTYQFSIKPIFKRLLLPFLIELIKKSPFDLYVKVAYKPNNLYINFSGKDEKLLLENRYALLNAFEQIIRTYLQSRIVLPNDLKIFVKCQKKSSNNSRKDGDGEKWLQELAQKTKKELDNNKKEVFTKELNPAHRRIIHQFFQELPEYATESIGEGRFKKIRVFWAEDQV